MKHLGWGCLLLLLLCLGQVRQVEAQSAEPQEIISLINNFRATLGLPPFEFNGQLAVAAQNQATYMAANNIYSHTGAGGSSPYDRAVSAGFAGRVSENIVGGTGMTPSQGVIWWRNSAIHYATITSGYYTEIGAGFATGSGQNFYAIVVGRPDGTPNQPASGGANSDILPAPIIVTPIPLSAPNEDGSIVHTLADGQALWTLAAYYDVDLDYLLRINNLDENDFVQPGDDILIQLADGQPTPTIPPTPTPPVFHAVREGQTLWSIAAFYDVELATLLYYNSLAENAFLQPGQEIRVRLLPGESPPPTATPQLTHIIGQGQTLWTVAALYGLTLDELLTFNNLAENAILQPGDELLIREPIVLDGNQISAEPTQTPTPTTIQPTTEAAARTPAPQPTATVDGAAPLAAVVQNAPVSEPTATQSSQNTVDAAENEVVVESQSPLRGNDEIGTIILLFGASLLLFVGGVYLRGLSDFQ